jgi:GNAT superfamily N-acetyltransferase
MPDIIMERVDQGNFPELVTLISALAEFEHLTPPDEEGVKRLREHALSPKPYFEAYLARSDGRAIAYLILIQTYSSFLARPTLFIEDIFVLEGYRGRGVGKTILLFCAEKAKAMDCGRMEWQALDWNINAIHFYERMGARQLKEWISFRMDADTIDRLLSK